MHLQRNLALGLVMMIALLTSHTTAAQDIETLVMPGEVIKGHFEFESECSSCHKLFNKQGQRQLCLDCHEEVAADFEQQTGFHGLRTEVQNDQCASCHTEHEGRDAVIVIMDEETFDHRFTDFQLEGPHADADCADCHSPELKHREAPSECVDCHFEDQPHQEVMGTECGSCHQPTEWLEAKFDHDETDYPLLGKHREATCLDCHEDRTFASPATNCFGCHASDDRHEGRNEEECETCHNPRDWTDTSFDHQRDTDFELLGNHALLQCDDCHSDDPYADKIKPVCISCHVEDDNHDAHNGQECGNCHNNSDWTESTFVHNLQTDYTLNGAHKEVLCNDCHIEPIFEAELNTTCDSCHLDDDAHEKSLGTQCENCHTEVSWQDPVFFDHDLTSFPLLGKHSEKECTDCHTNQAFGDTGSECTGCHKEEDPHRGYFSQVCGACHNPVGWDKVTFDHDLQTQFPLAGAHVRVSCEECHRSPLEKIKAIDGNCRTCHRAHDVHDGEFGTDCGRCHTADSFTEVRSIQ